MTNKEAIEVIESNRPTSGYTILCEALDIAKKALEKQIQKKVTHEATLYKCCTCPNCKNVVDRYTEFAGKKVRVTYIYCHFCGQKLDWSDTECQN